MVFLESRVLTPLHNHYKPELSSVHVSQYPRLRLWAHRFFSLLFLLRKAVPIQWHFLLTTEHQVFLLGSALQITSWESTSSSAAPEVAAAVRASLLYDFKQTSFSVTSNKPLILQLSNPWASKQSTPFLTKILISNVIQETRAIFTGTGSIRK